MTWDGRPAAGIQSGTVSSPSTIDANATGSLAVTFPVAYPATPKVLVSSGHSAVLAAWGSVSTTGFTLSWRNVTAAQTGASVPFSWEARP